MAQFIDVVKWLQGKLDELAAGCFKVSNERSLDSDFEGEVVVSALSGTPYEDSANIPYQIDVFTSNINSTMDVLNCLAKTVSNIPFEQIVVVGKDEEQHDIFSMHVITPLLNTPVVMEKDIPNGSQHFARIVVFATFVVFYDTNNIKEIKIDDEVIKTLSSSLNYTTEMMSNRVSGQKLNKSKKKAATVSINFTMINKNGVFGSNVFKITTGQLDGNTPFTVKITMSDNSSATLKMILGNSSFGSVRGQLPSLNVAMFLYDDRGDNNA